MKIRTVKLDGSTKGALLDLGFVGDFSDRSMIHERIGMLNFTETEKSKQNKMQVGRC